MKHGLLNFATIPVYQPATSRYFFSFQYRLMFCENVKCVQDNLFKSSVYSHFSTFSVNINSKNVNSSPLICGIPRHIVQALSCLRRVYFT